MKKILFVLLVSILGSGLNSCKKECPVVEPTLEEILTREGWKYDKIEVYVNGVLTNTNDLSGWERVYAPSGDYYTYNVQGQTTDYGTYVFNPDTDPMTISLQAFSANTPTNYIVEKLEEKEFVFYREEQIGSDLYKYVYVHSRD
jgi:hypothetical protein